jgi:hypothetical protein
MKNDNGADWRVYAPRWLLVLLAGGFCTFAVIGLRRHVEGTEHTVQRVAQLEKNQESTDRAISSMALQIAQVRVDTLRWQIHWSNDRGDKVFAKDLRDRLRDAERTLNMLRREVQIGNGVTNGTAN